MRRGRRGEKKGKGNGLVGAAAAAEVVAGTRVADGVVVSLPGVIPGRTWGARRWWFSKARRLCILFTILLYPWWSGRT